MTDWLADPNAPPILRFRHVSGLTQQEVAERTGISLRTYRRLERGQAPTMHQLIALCKLYGCHAEQLFPIRCDDVAP